MINPKLVYQVAKIIFDEENDPNDYKDFDEFLKAYSGDMFEYGRMAAEIIRLVKDFKEPIEV